MLDGVSVVSFFAFGVTSKLMESPNQNQNHNSTILGLILTTLQSQAISKMYCCAIYPDFSFDWSYRSPSTCRIALSIHKGKAFYVRRPIRQTGVF